MGPRPPRTDHRVPPPVGVRGPSHTVSGARALARPCSVLTPRTWLARAPACAPAAKQGAEHQYLGRIVRLTHHVEDLVLRAALHPLPLRKYSAEPRRTQRPSGVQEGRSRPSASSLMRKASFAASVGAPLVTASSRRAACVRRLPAPKSGPGLGPRCASRLERAGCPVRACQNGLEPPGFDPKVLSPASALHCAR